MHYGLNLHNSGVQLYSDRKCHLADWKCFCHIQCSRARCCCCESFASFMHSMPKILHMGITWSRCASADRQTQSCECKLEKFYMQGMGPMGGMGNMGGMAGMMNNPEMMSQMMQSPIMQSMLNDPEMLRNMIQSTPGMSEVTIVIPSFAFTCL